MNKIKAKELRVLLTDYISCLQIAETQNRIHAIQHGNIESPNYLKFVELNDERISKAKEMYLKTMYPDFQIVDETEEEEEEC